VKPWRHRCLSTHAASSPENRCRRVFRGRLYPNVPLLSAAPAPDDPDLLRGHVHRLRADVRQPGRPHPGIGRRTTRHPGPADGAHRALPPRRALPEAVLLLHARPADRRLRPLAHRPPGRRHDDRRLADHGPARPDVHRHRRHGRDHRRRHLRHPPRRRVRQRHADRHAGPARPPDRRARAAGAAGLRHQARLVPAHRGPQRDDLRPSPARHCAGHHGGGHRIAGDPRVGRREPAVRLRAHRPGQGPVQPACDRGARAPQFADPGDHPDRRRHRPADVRRDRHRGRVQHSRCGLQPAPGYPYRGRTAGGRLRQHSGDRVPRGEPDRRPPVRRPGPEDPL